MLQPPPPEPNSLEDLPEHPIAGQTLYRVWRSGNPPVRSEPWWFSSNTTPEGGRFDLPTPLGTLYTATSRVGAVLEALQANLTNLPVEELAVRRLATISAPVGTPTAADLCSPLVAGFGLTAAVWAGATRSLTQLWAGAVRRDGWWSLHAGVHHDPSGQLRSVAVFGTAGDAAPTLGGRWTYREDSLNDPAVADELAGYGIQVRGPGELPFVDLP